MSCKAIFDNSSNGISCNSLMLKSGNKNLYLNKKGLKSTNNVFEKLE